MRIRAAFTGLAPLLLASSAFSLECGTILTASSWLRPRLLETGEYQMIGTALDPLTKGTMITVKVKDPESNFYSMDRGEGLRGFWLFTSLFNKPMGQYGYTISPETGYLTYPDLGAANTRLDLAKNTPLATRMRHWSPLLRTFVNPHRFVSKLGRSQTVRVQTEPGAHFHDSIEHNYLFVPDSLWAWLNERVDAIDKLLGLLRWSRASMLKSKLNALRTGLGLAFDLESDSMLQRLLPEEGATLESPEYIEQVRSIFERLVTRADPEAGLEGNSAQDLALQIAERLPAEAKKLRKKILELLPKLGRTEITKDSLRNDARRFVDKVGTPDWEAYAKTKKFLLSVKPER